VPTTYEAKVVTRSGEIRWALFSGSRIEYEGKPAALGIAVDITERKLAEETLRKLTHRLSVASESANIGIWDLDLEKNHLVWDDRMYQMYGVSASDFGGALETWQGSLHPDDLDRASREVSEAISGTGDFHTSFRIVVPDGQVRYIEAHASVLNTPEGKPDRMVGVNLDITERKLAEEALRNSESLSRAVVYNSPVGISIRSAKGELLSVNDAWMKIWNLSPEEVEHFINEGPNDLAGVHKLRILGQWVPQIESVYRKGGVLRIPEVHYSDDSSARPRWVSFTYYSVMNDQGEVDRVIILTEDITERKLTDKALKERHKELNCLYSIYALSEEEDFSLYEILKKTITLIPPAWQFPEVTEAYVALDGLTVQTERFRETSWILASEIVVRDKPAGEVKVCYLEDWKADNEGPFLAEEKHLIKAIAERLGFIVESKLLKKELQESEEKFRRITERSFDAIYHVDVDGMLTYVSPAAERLAGYRPDDVIGRHVSEFITEKYLPSVGKALAITATGKVVEGLQFEIIAADAHLVFVEANATPIIHNDRVVATQALVRDISARRHAEQMLEKAHEEQSRQLRQVAGGLAHDIYNDLYPVSASIHKLRQRFEHPEDPNPERNLKLLQLMEGAVLRAIDLTEAVSLYSKLQRDTTSALTRIRKVIDQVLEHHKGRLDQLEVKTLVEVPDVLAVACSERNLHTLMTNLLLNSLDAVAGTQRPSLSIKARPTNGKVEITFGDNGSGIAPDILPRVFDPFFSTKPNTGTGLGLAIVKRVVDVCGGEIEVDSAVDIGTTFHILLPGDVGT
ncbi:MAG: PAS domain S-box protein, partial [candidate division Zixibacteria bacterium]|nr:PAS domain S-box protein [candidate division Zixibacteria bacterium]